MGAGTTTIDFLAEAHIPGVYSPPLDKSYSKAPFQKIDLIKLSTLRNSLNFSEMGCVAGTAKLTVLRGRTVRYITLAELHDKFNGLAKYPWDLSIPTKTLAFVDGRIRHHTIEGVSYTGKKAVVKVKLADGKWINVTTDHELLSEDGTWIEAGKIQLGTKVIVKGMKGAKSQGFNKKNRRNYRVVYYKQPVPGSTRVVVSGKYVYYVKREHRVVADALDPNIHVHHKDGDHLNNDLENLEKLTLSEHSRVHAKDQISSYDAPAVAVVDVIAVGFQDVYDISMQAPHHNFVANKIVVHNCYKTSTGLWLAELKVGQLPQSSTRPSILYLTSKTGKTPVLELVPYLLPEWSLYLLDTSGPTLLNPHTKRSAPASIYLGHYELLQKRGKFSKVLLDHQWTMVIADEAHKFKSPKSQTTRAVWKLKAKFKHLMTGSPFANNIGELYSLLHWVAPREFKSYNEFKKEYAVIETDGYGFEKYSKDGITSEQAVAIKKIISRFGVRHTKKELFPQLPDLYPPTRHPVELSKIQRQMYQDFRNSMEAQDQRGEFILTPTVLAQLTRLRQLCAATPYKEDEYYDSDLGRLVYRIRLEEPSNKLDACMDIIEDTNRPLVVFSCFNDTLHLLKERLDKKHITCIQLEAKDKDLTRQQKVRVFQNGQAQVFLTGIKLGGESITLTNADTVVFIDREWNPQRNEQAIARCWRPGQKNAVQVFYIEARRTVDQKVEADIYGKMVTWKQVFD